ncbi:MAG: PAS domain S-box protein [Vicinamibacteria bacterium]|nr:PAS domain S-box protein [Vicinamibacteria bacterium]
MPDTPGLRQRLRKLAAEKSYLQLLIRLMSRVPASPGLDNVVAALLQGVVEVIGGTGTALYYRIGGEYALQELSGRRARMREVDDADVRTAFESGAPVERVHDAARTLMESSEFPHAYTWVHPLTVGPDVVAVLRIEDLHVGMAEFQGDLSAFFNHAALVLRNGIVEEQVRERTVELEHAKERYRAFFDHSPDGIVLIDPGTARILEFNDQACRQLGYSREEFARLTVMDVQANESAEQTRDTIRRVMERGVEDFETLQRTRDGQFRNVHVTAQYVRVGPLAHYQCVWRDVTERRRQEEAHRQLLAQNQALYEAIPDLIFLLRRDGRFVAVHAPDPGLLYAPKEDFIGRGVAEVLPPPVSTRLKKAFADALDSRLAQEITYLLPVDGVERSYEARIVPCGTDEVVAMVRDITARQVAEHERRSLEAQLQHLQRMESVGRLAGGIAHDMNNVLAAIMAVGAVLEDRGGETGRDADLILQACRRGRDLIQGLMEFSRKAVEGVALLDLNELVRQESELLASTTLQRIAVRTELAPDLPKLLGSASALSTALMNLCVNALDAMPGGGTLVLSTARRGERHVELAVEDTGHGMPPEVLARAMEPFFTTKPVGKGTGLGLSRVFGAVQAHGGSVEIQSKPGLGTRVLITLPVVLGDRPLAPRAATTRPRAGQAFRLLMVDDDPLVRETWPALLEAMGHQVAVATSGFEALGMLEHGGDWDVVLLDQNMPGLDGVETLARLRQQRPDLPVILATGFLDATARERLRGLTRVCVLAKPLSAEEFQQALAAVTSTPA